MDAFMLLVTLGGRIVVTERPDSGALVGAQLLAAG